MTPAGNPKKEFSKRFVLQGFVSDENVFLDPFKKCELIGTDGEDAVAMAGYCSRTVVFT